MPQIPLPPAPLQGPIGYVDGRPVMIDQRAWGVWLRTLHNLIRTLGGTSIQDLSDTSLTAAQLEDLTDGGDTALHFHSSDRDRANHTGTQLASTISDFNEELVRNPFLALIAAGA